MSAAVDKAWQITDRMAAKLGLGMLGGLAVGIGFCVFIRMQGIWPGDPYAPVRTIVSLGLGLFCGYVWGVFAERQDIRQSGLAVKGLLLLLPMFWLVVAAIGLTHVVTGQIATSRMLAEVETIAHAEHLSVSVTQGFSTRRSVTSISGAKLTQFQAALVHSRGYFPSHDTSEHEGTIVIHLDRGTPIEWGWYVRDDLRSSLIFDNGDAYVIVPEGWRPLREILGEGK